MRLRLLSPAVGTSILGASVKRVEDPRFITGSGRYLSDLDVGESLWMVPVRSTIPHGVLGDIDIEAASTVAGVVRIYLAGDLDIQPVPVGAPGLDDVVRRPAIAADRVRFVGDIVAVVVATTERAAVDAADLVWPDIDPLSAATTPTEAAASEAELLFPELGTNVVYDRGEPNHAALADAEVVVDTTVTNQRLAAVPLDTSGAVAVPTGDGGVEVWAGAQTAHGHQAAIASMLGLDKSKVRVRVPDVGGSFGAKIAIYPEQALCAAIALDLDRPVRWQETRTENMLSMNHGRAQVTHIRMGATRDGRITGVAIDVTQDAGAYPRFAAYLPVFSSRMAVGPYDIPEVEFIWRTMVTNTTPVDAYRGAGRPEATLALERAIDQLALELGMDPAEVRRRNFISPDAFPYETALGERYDSGEYESALDRALEIGDYAALRAEQRRRRETQERWQMGIGVGSYVEITAGGMRADWGAVDIDSAGVATVFSAGVSHGHSHETTFAQMISQQLRIPLDKIRFVQGDTDVIGQSGGTMGSRSLQVSGSAVLGAGENALVKAREIFAHYAEAAVEDVVQFDDGSVGVVGVPTSAMTLAEIAALATDPTKIPEGMEPGLRGELTFEQTHPTFPFGTHLSVVEVDTETGDVRVVRHIACDDAGPILSRMVVDGQVHGGVAQGIGQSLLEQFLYEDGNPTTGNLTTYLIPSAGNIPLIEIDHTETPSPENPLGAKGIGEAGTIGSMPAVVNAVIDALSPFGVRHVDMPLTPSRIWAAIQP